MRPPCNKDCPERTAECKLTCKAWAEYETEYLKAHKQKQENYEHAADFWANLIDQIERNKKKVKH